MFAALVWILIAAQYPEPPILPQGWTGQANSRYDRLEHISGASLNVWTRSPEEDFDTFTRRAVEALARPLGFAKISAPRHFSDSNQRWVEYEVRGNRLTQRRRILYRAVRINRDIREIIYENSEERFDVLLSEALSLVSSLESVARKIRVRQ